ncbi:PQQ-dependent sugar dehydrogenase [Alteraurantiacibacter aquimixticola]|nr:PQQ-dependent sugar dehydrogenase [Alteraurantiacibacter aquimixticola]
MKVLKALAAVSALALCSSMAVAQDEEPAGAPPFQGTELADGPWSFATDEADIAVTVVTRELERPWGMVWTPEGDILVTERVGRLRVIRDGVLDPTPIAGLPAMYTLGIAGLNDIALHPDFAENRLVYMAYSKADPEDPQNSVIAVMRGRWDGGHELTDVEDIFVANAWYGAQPVPEKCCGQGPAFGSFGGRILFDPDGYLYIASGDRNFGEMVADPSNHFGKILRLNDDGSVPAGNPWVGKDGHAPEVWSTGHRNPLGLTYNSITGEIWESEFGPRGGDEVNRILRGGDYGWMSVTQGFHYDGQQQEYLRNRPGKQDPVLVYGPPSLNPGNLAFYDGSLFPAWHGDLFLASFTQGLLRYDTNQQGMPVGEPEHMLRELGQRWRDVRTGPDGALYLLTDMGEGALIRIAPAE